MRRYRFLDKENIFEVFNKLRSAFLAAKDGEEVDQIIKGILTNDERMKIGRRIIISQLLEDDLTYEEISKNYKIGKQTIIQVQKLKEKYPKCFELINAREIKVEDEYHQKAYRMTGNPKSFLKFPKYTGYKRSKIKR